MKWNTARPLGDQGEYDVAAVAVRELLAGRELRLVPVEHGQILLGRRELVHGNRHQVVRDLVIGVLVQVVADARAVRQQVLDGDVVADERKISAEHRACRRRELERAVLDEARDCYGSQSLGGARSCELGVDRVRDPETAMRKPIRLCKLDLTVTIDAYDAREVVRRGDRIDLDLQGLHSPDATRREWATVPSLSFTQCYTATSLDGFIVADPAKP